MLGGFLVSNQQSDFVVPHDCCVFEILYCSIAKEWNCSSTIPSECISCSCCLGCGAFTYSNVPMFIHFWVESNLINHSSHGLKAHIFSRVRAVLAAANRQEFRSNKCHLLGV